MAFLDSVRFRVPSKSLAIALAFGGMVHPVLACSCPSHTPERTAERLQRAVKFRVLDFRMTSKDGGDPVAKASAEVIRQPVVGKFPSKLVLTSLGRAENGNCGAAGALFESLSSGAPIFAVIDRSPKQKNAFELISCSIMEEPKLSRSSIAPRESEAAHGLY